MNEILKEHLSREEWYKELFDNAHDLIHIAEPDGTLLYVNRSWLDLLEYSKEEIQGHSFFSFIEETDRNRFFQYRESIIRDSNLPGEEIQIHLRRRSGTTVCIAGFVSVKYLKGEAVYTRGIFRDITARVQQDEQLKQYTRELSEREYNLQQLLENAPDAVVVINKESIISFWNPKAEAIFGWSAEEAIGKRLSETIIPPQHRLAHNNGMKRYLDTGVPHVMNKTFEITALNKSGKEFFIALTISTTRQKDDIAFVAFIRDISEQKENLLALERKTKELERSNANLEEFAYAATHDLKEPIRKIHIFSDLLKEKLSSELTEDANMLFCRMQLATERMQLLIDDLLEYSHVNKGVDLSETVDLNKKVQLVLTDLEVPVKEKNARITIGQLPIIRGHRRQLQQVFQNLISNSLKYTKPNVTPEINITCEIVTGSEIPGDISAAEKQNDFYLIKVIDNGIGFSELHAEKIFQVFQRLHGNSEYKGSGVGLSIVRKVLQNHGGYIFAESQPGEGSTFKLYLPVKEVS